MTDILLVLGSNIRKIRKEFGWTQADLAEKTGISVPFMTQIELGRKSASLEVVQNIAAALNISYKQLFEENIAASNQFVIIRTKHNFFCCKENSRRIY